MNDGGGDLKSEMRDLKSDPGATRGLHLRFHDSNVNLQNLSLSELANPQLLLHRSAKVLPDSANLGPAVG